MKSIFSIMIEYLKRKKIYFLILLPILFISCHENKNLFPIFQSNLKIIEQDSTIHINAVAYNLTIDKARAVAHLNNYSGEQYTTFPFNVQLSEISEPDSSHLRHEWKIKGKTVELKSFTDDSLFQKAHLTFYKKYFEVKFQIILPENAGSGIYIFSRDGSGFDTSQWSEYFSPEPDDYFNRKPTIDIRADRDQQWKFTPAPLNLSFHTSAGWFSVGLSELADASIFTFRKNAIWLNLFWSKISNLDEGFCSLPSLVITFNSSPWEAVKDYSEFVFQKKLKIIPQQEKKNGADWWKQPIFSTRGEQLSQGFSPDDPRYNLEWVKEYISAQREKFGNIDFTFILEDKWNNTYGDPNPSERFSELRQFIDWCHDQKIKVILSWKAWKVERNSLAAQYRLSDKEYCDATNGLFHAYVDSCCRIMLGNGKNELNADGLQVDNLFLVRDPSGAHYRDSSKGMGIKEVFLYLQSFYLHAKEYKPDALIISSAIDPHFFQIQDMVKIHDDWDNKLRREKRARIILSSLPAMLINGGATEMYNKIASYHYVTSAIFGVPAVHYLDRFADGVISEQNQKCIQLMLKFAHEKPSGEIRFLDYGKWQIVDNKKNVLVESLPGVKGIIVYENKHQAKLYCTDNKNVHLFLEDYQLNNVEDEKGKEILFKDMGHGIYELNGLSCGETYRLNLMKIRMLTR